MDSHVQAEVSYLTCSWRKISSATMEHVGTLTILCIFAHMISLELLIPRCIDISVGKDNVGISDGLAPVVLELDLKPAYSLWHKTSPCLSNEGGMLGNKFTCSFLTQQRF